ncbi:MAG: HGGxSTG domain-containing protein [Thermodesulfobacteriota bacterium]|jgi:hypothetical protein
MPWTGQKREERIPIRDILRMFREWSKARAGDEKNKTEVIPHGSQPCGAKTRAGTHCKNWGMPKNGRCRMHGGKSTGPRTPEGLERIRKANWKHGRYSKEERESRDRIRFLRLCLRVFGTGL